MWFNEFARFALIIATFGRALEVEAVTVIIQSVRFDVIMQFHSYYNFYYYYYYCYFYYLSHAWDSIHIKFGCILVNKFFTIRLQILHVILCSPCICMHLFIYLDKILKYIIKNAAIILNSRKFFWIAYDDTGKNKFMWIIFPPKLNT